MADEQHIEVIENPAKERFEISVNGVTAGFSVYHHASEDTLAFVHTEIAEEFGGRGLAGRLVGVAMEEMQRRRLAVLPYCPFVQAYLVKHPDLIDLVPAERRATFGL